MTDQPNNPPADEKFYRGYKGAGMCANCAYQGNKIPNTNKFLCNYYGSACVRVSWNCSGIRSLKEMKTERSKHVK